MKRPDATSVLPALCLAVSAGVTAWALGSGAEAEAGFRLGVALALMLAFGLVWVFGIRYPDVGWMVVVTALLALQTLAASLTGPLGTALAATMQLAFQLALAAYLLAFFRAARRPGLTEAGFVAATLAVFVLSLCLPAPTLARFGLTGGLQLYLGAVLLGYAAIQGFQSLAPLPPKRQRYVGLVVAASVVWLGLDLVAARHGSRGLTAAVDYGFVIVLAGFLLADLVIYHRNYLRERATRGFGGPGQGEAARVARTELGRAMRALMPAPALTSNYGDFVREFVVRRSPRFGGDWHYVWETATEQRLLFGDVRGVGPAPALGVAAVLAFLYEAQARSLGLEEALRYINERLLDVFERQVQTTALAVSLGADGSAELFNCGGMGFVTVTREGGRHWTLSSTPLGASAALEVGYAAVPLEDLDVLFAATDGVVDGPAGTRRLLDFYDREMDLTLELAAVRDQVLRFAGHGPGASEDDGTLLVIQRRNAGVAGGESTGTRRA